MMESFNLNENGICILGISCRVPKADNVEEFWNNLKEGVDMAGDSSLRWPNGLYGLPPSLSVLNDITKFDSEFFGYSPEEAKLMDPQIRVMLEVAIEAILDSGLERCDLSSGPCGIYTAVRQSEVEPLNYPIENCATSMHAAKLAQFLKLNGPSMCIDCACSSSLVAVHLATKALQLKKIKFALITATSLLLSPNQSLQNMHLGVLSQSGKCHTWDEAADGYVRAEGVFAIVLGYGNQHPRLYAEIVASGTNSDGYKEEGIAHPSRKTQLKLLREIYSEVSLSEVTYIECHGTGTQAGDPTEVGAICDLIAEKNVDHPILIGSCKSNMGHAEWAAGLAGLIKAVLCIQHKFIPPNLNLNKLNSKIVGIADGTVIPVADELIGLPSGLVGVSAMGFGGSNCHVVLKPIQPQNQSDLPKYLLVLTAASTADGSKNLKKEISKIVQYNTLCLINQAFCSDLCSSLPYRQYSIFKRKGSVYDHENLTQDSLTSVKQNNSVYLIIHDVAITSNCSLNDSGDCLVYRNASRRVAELVSPESLKDILSVSSCLILGLLTVLNDSGINFEGCLGAGISDLIAAAVDDRLYNCNAIKIAEILEIVIKQNFSGLPTRKVFEIDTDADTLLQMFTLEMEIICYNTFVSTTISFPVNYEKEFVEKLEQKNIKFREITMFYTGLYTHLMTDISKIIKSVHPDLFKGESETPFRSSNWMNTTSSGVSYANNIQEPINANYVAKLIRSPCYLASAIGRIPQDSVKLHIGIYRKPEWVPDNDIYIEASSYLSIVKAIGMLYLKGLTIDTRVLNNVTQQLSENCGSIGHLIQWDHSVTWPVPHWLQFSATVKDEKNETCYLMSWNGSLVSMLCPIWKRLSISYNETPGAIIELNNLDSFIDDINQNGSTNFVLHVLQGAKKFKAFNLEGKSVFLQGYYSTQNPTYMTPNVFPLHLDVQNESTISFDVVWSKNVIENIELVIKKLNQLASEQNKKLCITNFALEEDKFPEKNQTVKFRTDLKCGICIGPGILVRTVPVWTQSIFPRTSSNVSLLSIALDVSDIMGSPREAMPIDVHVLRIYQLHDCLENKPSFILVFCGKSSDHHHNIGISVITNNSLLSYTNIVPVPSKACCLEAVAVLIPYLLACSISEKVKPNNDREDMVIVSEKADCLLSCLLVQCQPTVQSITAVINEELLQNFPLTAFESKLSDDQQTEHATNLSMHPQVSTPFKPTKIAPRISVGGMSPFLHSVPDDTLNASHYVNESLLMDNQETFTLSSILEELFPKIVFIPLTETPIAMTDLKTNNSNTKLVISLNSDITKSSNLLSRGGTLIHLGEVKTCNLKTDIFSNNCTVYTVNPSFTFNKILEMINDDIPFVATDFSEKLWPNMWQTFNRIKQVVPIEREDNLAFTSSSSVYLKYPIDLHLVHKHVQKNLVENTLGKPKSERFNDNSWLGKLQCIVAVSQEKSYPVFEGPPICSPSPINLRPQTPAPRVHFPSTATDTPKSPVIKFSHEEIQSPTGIKTTVPLSRRNDQSVLVKMNDVNEGTPVFLIHPVTGVLNTLRCFANELPLPCYGVQQTVQTPSDSFTNLAKFYLNCCCSVNGNNPLILIGYSYGASIAFAMALEAQKLNLTVSHVILLDGSPDYIKCPLQLTRQSYTADEVPSVLDSEKLLAFLQIYGNVEANSIRAELRQAKDRNQRIAIAVNHLNTCESPRPQTKWQIACQEVLNRQPSLFRATKQILFKQRLERAKMFLTNMDLIDEWTVPNEIFQGDVHLFRIKDTPLHCPTLPLDYGLQKLISGSVDIRCYEETHESLVGMKCLQRLIPDIMLILSR